ncbi:hypothetical protein [Flavobacterium gyeonganense]|uniref:Uncharacterized protein n=1 Tax=Flavobacterium gyeonganense TaxID=1310418 RepID=A0ABV5HAI8_9FLAO|nr:hypothetical protein [Flavobacterium gyeonganense]
MKKIKKIGFYVLIVFVFSCQKENNQEDVAPALVVQNENWLSAKLDAKFASSQKEVAAYLFPISEMKLLMERPNITQVHFKLGFVDNIIQMQVASVDESDHELGIVKSSILKESIFRSELANLKALSVSATKKRTELLNSHLLSPRDASLWISEWQKKLSNISELDEVTSYEGNRFRYFNLEAEVVKVMLYNGNVNLGAFFGINPKGKATIILIGLDKNNQVKKTSVTSEETEDIYDGTRPCPPCIEEENPIK